LQLQKERKRREAKYLLQEGLNPYEVERRRKRAAVVRAQEVKLAEKLRNGQEAIMAQLLREGIRHHTEATAAAKSKVLAPEQIWCSCACGRYFYFPAMLQTSATERSVCARGSHLQ
jgi:hypothetical protein